jgi:protocatechuate 3,4-dioxygenase beta subunit
MSYSIFRQWGVMALLVAAAAQGAAHSIDSSLTLTSADEPGEKLVVSGLIVDRSGRPLPGVQVHVYQTDASGRYTLERPMDEPHARLSGWLRTDAQGRFELRTIHPGGYQHTRRLEGRDRKIPAHIHLDVTAPGCAPCRFQAVFADDPLLTDPYWESWVKKLHQPVLTVRSAGAVKTAELRISL